LFTHLQWLKFGHTEHFVASCSYIPEEGFKMKYPIPKLAALTSSLPLFNGRSMMPNGLSMMALPGTGKTFERFRADDTDCRQCALSQAGGVTKNPAAADSELRSALGTAVGAAGVGAGYWKVV
jgi:hypothetical protein